MKDLIVRFSEEHAAKGKEELSLLLDSEIEDFSRFMATIGDWRVAGPLTKMERALVKTYLVQKLTGKIDGGA
jgi:hypothetical protein